MPISTTIAIQKPFLKEQPAFIMLHKTAGYYKNLYKDDILKNNIKKKEKERKKLGNRRGNIFLSDLQVFLISETKV